MLALLYKELYLLFRSAVSYVALGLFLLVLGLFLWFFPTENNVLMSGVASLEPMFLIVPYVLMFVVPAVTMRSFSEERSLGTLELLLSKPISNWQLVLAKFLAGFIVISIGLLATLVYFFSVHLWLSKHSIDLGSFWGSYIGLYFLTAAFVSIGLFASSLTSSQVIAFLVGIVLILCLFLGFELISRVGFLRTIAQFLSYLGISQHYQSISKGVVDTRDLVYFLSLIFVFLYSTKLVIEVRK